MTSVIATKMSEAELEQHVAAYCRDLGIFRYHTWDSRRSQSGWPDDVLVGRQGILYRELKTERGRLTAGQRKVGSQLTRAGANWSIWRPRDLVSGVIIAQLREIA